MNHAHSALDPSELLGHVEGLRRLARRLVRDDGDADDLVQDTLVVAIERGPPTGVAPRPWLFGVLKNMRRRSLRTTSRRTALEERTARRESVHGGVDAVSRAETYRRLVDEVIRLDEPYRTTLILRFFDGLDVADIAARQKAPAATVRVRVHRGLALLRERLDARGGRVAWTAAFVAASGEPAGPTPARASTSTSIPLAAKAGVAAAVLVAAGVVFLAWPRAEVDEPAVAAAPVAPAPRPERRRAETPAPPAEAPVPAVVAAPAPLDEAALRARAQAALDDVLALQLGVASKADCLALVDSWVKEGPSFVPVLSRLLDPSIAVGRTDERDLIDALVLLAVSEISGEEGVRGLLAGRPDALISDARRTWFARTATADEIAALTGPYSFEVQRTARGFGELSEGARTALRQTGNPSALAFLARHGDAAAVERLATMWAESAANGVVGSKTSDAVGALPSDRLARLCGGLPATTRKGPSDPATALLAALVSTPPREEADLTALLEWARPMSVERREAAAAVVLSARMARSKGPPPSLSETAATLDGDADRALAAAERLPPDAALVCLAHWAAAEQSSGGGAGDPVRREATRGEPGPRLSTPSTHGAGQAMSALGRRVADLVQRETQTPPRARTFLDAPPDETTVSALRAAPWPQGDLRSIALAAGIEFHLAGRGARAAVRDEGGTGGVRDFVRETDTLGRAGGDNARIAEGMLSVLAPYEESGGSIETVLARPEMKTKASGPTVAAVLRGAAAGGRESAARLHDVFVRVALEHPDDSTAGEAAELAVRTSTTADQFEDVVRKIVATGRKRPVERAFKGVRAVGRILRDLTPERLGALVIAAVEAPIPDKVIEEILDEVEDAEEGRDADFRARFVAVLERCAPRSPKAREELKKALDDFRKPPKPM